MTPAAIKPTITINSFGDHERTVVAGLKTERADPRKIVGLQALFVVNLAPRKMKGVLSEGMLFDIGYADGIVPVLAVPEQAVPDGARRVGSGEGRKRAPGARELRGQSLRR